MKEGLGLVRALLEKKPIIFFINPPYGTAGSLKNIRQEQSFGTICQVNWDIIHNSIFQQCREETFSFLFHIK